MEEEECVEAGKSVKKDSTMSSTTSATGSSPSPYAYSPSLAREKKALLADRGGERDEASCSEELDESKEGKDGKTLVTAFLIMIVVGTGNRIFMKLQTYPMYNYPMFLNLFATFVYIPACFLYIIPMIWFGSAITKEQRAIPKYKFMVMGLLDSVSGIMGVFAVNYISNAGMIVLLQQASIPISMAISKICLNARYTTPQYIGATIVVAGIFSTLIPTFLGQGTGSGDGDEDPAAAATQVFWMCVQVASCIPMCLSSVYKEKALGDEDVDVIYLNGWVAVYQLLASLVCAIPSAWLTDLPLADLPGNVMDGWSCYLGKDSISANMLVKDVHMGEEMNLMTLDVDHCEMAPYYVSAYLFFNILYNIVLIVILKHGSASVLFMASTVMVPIGNVAFSLHFIPGHQDMRRTDVLGLLVIVMGLVVYRFSGPLISHLRSRSHVETAEEKLNHKKAKLVARGITRNTAKYLGLSQNQFDFLEPILSTRVWTAQKAHLLSRSPAQIRGSFFLRLGIPPSPALQRGLDSRNVVPTRGGYGSPAIAKAKLGQGYKRSPVISSRDNKVPNQSPSPLALSSSSPLVVPSSSSSAASSSSSSSSTVAKPSLLGGAEARGLNKGGSSNSGGRFHARSSSTGGGGIGGGSSSSGGGGGSSSTSRGRQLHSASPPLDIAYQPVPSAAATESSSSSPAAARSQRQSASSTSSSSKLRPKGGAGSGGSGSYGAV